MILLTTGEIQKAVNGKVSSGFDPKEKNSGISTDSRTIKKGEAFFAIKGEKFDGAEFVDDALKNGASVVVISGNKKKGKNIINVSNANKALMALALYYRKKINPKVCGITGSNGKTTTKDVLAMLLKDIYNVTENKGSFNNEIGLPLTILNMANKTEILVLEMGMSGKGELDLLKKIALPDVGIITNVGPAHLEYFSSLKEIASAKAELIENLAEDKTAVLNADDKFYDFFKSRTKAKIISFGITNKSDFMAENINLIPFKGSKFVLNASGKKIKIKTSLPGIHNVYNILAATAAASIFENNLNLLAEKLEKAQPPKMRLEGVKLKGIEIVNDAYNANPNSVMAGLKELGNYGTGGRRIFVFGGMLELGNDSGVYHKKIGEEIVRQKIDYLVVKESDGTIITSNAALKRGMDINKIFSARTNEEIADILLSFIKKQDIVLFKGSRAVKLEEAVELLKSKIKK
ncbi:MAG: UDP-N-acetylmuramoyl-tripeptide--D-alanyl-D-alanine ligase [bacterium]|nr:UDP-N-acetylmuramoyl-tripeptide--D-alanyl-D-alanine ligase [bacterium]